MTPHIVFKDEVVKEIIIYTQLLSNHYALHLLVYNFDAMQMPESDCYFSQG